MREKFIEKKFSPAHLALIADANAIIAEYRQQGFILTLRQLYYQFVARDKLANRQKEYKRLGGIINDARLGGLIDWDAIEDRTRHLRSPSAWDNPASIVEACASQFKMDLWRTQPVRFEVWIEKDALVGVIEPVCEELRLPFFACRGYSSQSEQYTAGKRLARYRRNGQRVVVLHLGDHDPSGLDMTRDNEDRLSMFAGGPIKVERLALNMPQVEEYGPPPNPAKATDARFAGYQAEHGDESWELDALEPSVIAALIRDHVTGEFDPDKWEEALAEENTAKAQLQAVSDRWDEVADFVA